MPARRVPPKSPARQRTPLRVSPIPRLIPRQRAALFARADQYAKEILVATVTNSLATEAVDEALYALMRQSSYYKPALEAVGTAQGDLMNACYDAGLSLGLAFGMRLRRA